MAHERAVKAAETLFKVQVQEWKNVLLRGSDPEALGKYWGQFESTEKQVRQAVGDLAKLVAEPTVRAHLESFLKVHNEVAAAYRKGLEAYKAAGFDSKVGDKAVKGIDRAPAEFLEKAAQGLAVAVKASTEHAQAADGRAGLGGRIDRDRPHSRPAGVRVSHPPLRDAPGDAAGRRPAAHGRRGLHRHASYESNDELGDIGASAG